MIQAGFDNLFGFESGRALGPLLFAAAAGVTASVLRRVGYSLFMRTMLVIILVGNTVAISQAFTGYLDGPLYELALILICALVLMLDEPHSPATLIAAAALVLLINTKLAAVFFAALSIGTWLLVLVWREGVSGLWMWLRCRRRDLLLLASAGLIAVLFVGWRPYMVNLVEHHTIIYPPPRELGYRPREPGQVPPNLDRAGCGRKLAALFFARTNVDGGPVEYKIPGTWTSHELRMASDTRNGGFGPFFGIEMVLSAAAFTWTISRCLRLRHLELQWSLALTALLTTTLFPEPWWARFVPLAWVLPIAAILLAAAGRPGLVVNGLATLVFSLASINMAIAGYSSVADALNAAQDLREKARSMSLDAQPVYLSRGTLWNSTIKGRHAAEDVWRERLRELGKTDVMILPRSSCIPVQFLSVDVQRCRPWPEPQLPSIQK